MCDSKSGFWWPSVHAAGSYDSGWGVDGHEEAGLPHQLHLLITSAWGLLSLDRGWDQSRNDFFHLWAQFTTEIAFHLIHSNW